MKKLFTLAASFIIWGSSFSQTIQGNLSDATENAPLEYASIALYLQSDSLLVEGEVTNTKGDFLISGLKPGVYYLTASFMGYETKTLSNLLIEQGKTLDIGNISLRPDQRMLDEIEISGKKATVINKVDRQVFNTEEFQASKGGTATDVLRNLPSITVNAQGEISSRGTTGFVILINGKPIQTEASVLLNQLPANSVQKVEIITAPSAKYDPEGKAGIINIITQKGSIEGLFTQLNIRGGLPSIENYDNAEYSQRYGADFTLNYLKDKWDLSAGLSFLRNDMSGRREGDAFTIINDTTTRFPSDGERSFDEINYSGRFTVAYRPDSLNEFSLGFFAGKRTKERTADILYYDNHATVDMDRVYTFQYFNENLRIRRGDFVLGSIDYKHLFKNQSYISTSMLYEYTLLGGPTTNLNLGWPNTDILYQEEYNTNNNPLRGLRYQLDYRSALTRIGVFEAGYQFRSLIHTGDFVYQRKNNESGEFELVPDFSSEVDLDRKIHSVYSQVSGNKGKWSYGLGVRIEYMDRKLDLQDKTGTLDTSYVYDFVQPFPTANLQYTLNEDLRIKTAYSRRVERTTTFKMNPFPEREHSEVLEQGDPELLPEFIDVVELGVVKDFGVNSIFATAYFRNTNNLVNRVNTVYNDTILNRIYSNVGKGKSIGMELGGDIALSENWNLFAGGNVYQFDIAGSFDNRPVQNSAWIYSFNVNSSLELPKDFFLQLTFNYISAKNTAQGIDSRFYSPNLTLSKSFLDERLSANIQWLNIDMGLLNTAEKSISTSRNGSFYTITHYVNEVDMVLLNLSWVLSRSKNKAKFIKSEFGEKEF